MNDLRKAAEMALEALEDILEDAHGRMRRLQSKSTTPSTNP
jgi:hypothetical protein